MKYLEICTKEGLKAYVKSNGCHFFDSDTMRFFRSRLEYPIIQRNGFVYFITSEQFTFEDTIAPRLYTVRKMALFTVPLSHEEIGTFQEHKTLADARKALRSYLESNH